MLHCTSQHRRHFSIFSRKDLNFDFLLRLKGSKKEPLAGVLLILAAINRHKILWRYVCGNYGGIPMIP